MIQFTRLVSEKFRVSESVAQSVCSCFEQGDWPYYIADYVPEIAGELELAQVWEIFDFLTEIADLAPKKKRLIGALQKAGTLSDAIQRRVDSSIDPYELDDMMIIHRPNTRSRAQLAIQKGLGPLAETIIAQTVEQGSVDDLAQAFIGKHASLKTADDVLQGVRDILAERFAYDETARAMAREFCFEDGYFTVVPKDRKDPEYAAYRDKELPIQQIAHDEAVKLLWADEQKRIRLKLGVQLFRITEVLRQNFIENPDSVSFDIICQAIDDGWERLLQSIVERDIKDRICRSAHAWALKEVAHNIPVAESGQENAAVVGAGIDSAGGLVCVAMNTEGRLLGATREQEAVNDSRHSDRLGKFLLRYRPGRVLAVKTAENSIIEAVVKRTVEHEACSAEVLAVVGAGEVPGICDSQWMTEKCRDLDPAMRAVYGASLQWLKPLGLMAEIGAGYFEFHPLQRYLPSERVNAVVGRVGVERALHRGVPVRDAADSPLNQMKGMPEGLLAAVRAKDIAEPLSGKSDLLNVAGMTETVYRNIAGYVVLPSSAYPLDSTLVHPYFFEHVEDAAHQLKVSAEGLLVNPSVLNGYDGEDFQWQLYMRKHIIAQLTAGQRIAQTRQGPRRKLRLEELQEGMVLQGKITNLSQFGAFVNINAMCDGLVHISQLADTFVESPQQVVSVGDTVHVRVVKVDSKMRRISLSMKGLGARTPRVRPTENHINNLIDHFSNR